MLQSSEGVPPPVLLLEPAHALVLPRHRSAVVQYAEGEAGARELRLFYGGKEIVFDEPELFGFGEALCRRGRFTGAEALAWAEGRTWPQMREVLEQLLDEGVLQHAEGADAQPAPSPRERASPLPPAPSAEPRTWDACESITAQFAGRSLELGYLELVVPIFRVAHMSLDADARQVGEANVFPPALRVETPTEWLACTYPGTRFQDARPMNLTALKAMREHWSQMMAVLLQVREAYLARFPDARAGWTVGHLERLSTAVLALPSWLLLRAESPVANGALHPALSCLFRVTDGLRLTMHQMLFVPVGEATRSPDAPMTSGEVYAYAERNYGFHSEHGVCAGPRVMVEEFLAVLVDGASPRGGLPEVLHPDVAAACEAIPPAMDYGFLGLQAYAATFSTWPAMARSYAAIGEVLAAWTESRTLSGDQLAARWDDHIERLRFATYLGSDELRDTRDEVYADMFARCEEGLTGVQPTVGLSERLAGAHDSSQGCEARLRALLAERLGAETPVWVIDGVAGAVLGFLTRTQAILKLAVDVQDRINAHLGRAVPIRSFDAYDLDIHIRLQGEANPRLPFLLDELRSALGIEVVLDAHRLEISAAGSAA